MEIKKKDKPDVPNIKSHKTGYKSEKFYYAAAIFFSIIGFLAFIVSGFLIINDSRYFNLSTNMNLPNASKFGDFIGGVIGAIWSFTGVIFLFLTFRVQQRQYERQQFENAFFEMLNILHDIVNNTKYITKIYTTTGYSYQKESSGKAFFNDVLVEFKSKIIHDAANSNLPIEDIFEEVVPFKYKSSYIIQIFENVNNEYRLQISHYFRYIYNIFKYIIDNRENYLEQKKYIDLIQAQLSTHEMGLIFYNAQCKYSRNKDKILKFSKLLDDFQFFENIDKESLIQSDDCNFYPNTEFKFMPKKQNEQSK